MLGEIKNMKTKTQLIKIFESKEKSNSSFKEYRELTLKENSRLFDALVKKSSENGLNEQKTTNLVVVTE